MVDFISTGEKQRKTGPAERRTCPMMSNMMNGMQMCCMCNCRMRDSRTWDAARHVNVSCCCQ